jgi:hypothetical protein
MDSPNRSNGLHLIHHRGRQWHQRSLKLDREISMTALRDHEIMLWRLPLIPDHR